MACGTKFRPVTSICLRLWSPNIFKINTKSFHTDCFNFTRNRLLCGTRSSVTETLVQCKYIHNIRSCRRFNNTETHPLTVSEQISTHCKIDKLLQKIKPFCYQLSRHFNSSCHRNTEVKLLKAPVKTPFCHQWSHHFNSSCHRNTEVKLLKAPVKTLFCHQLSRHFNYSCHRNTEVKLLKAPVKTPFCHQWSHHFNYSCHRNTEVKLLKAPVKTLFCHQMSRHFSSSCHRNTEVKLFKAFIETPFCHQWRRVFSSSCSRNTEVNDGKKIMPPPQTMTKKRPRPKSKHTERTGNREVIAYSTAEEYDLESLKSELINQGLYNITNLPFDMTDVIHVTPKYPVNGTVREIFFLREGSVVFWEVTENERDEVLYSLGKHGIGNYDIHQSYKELEWFQFKETQNNSDLVKGVIHLNNTARDGENVLEKYSFSHALSQSVQLNMWEAALDEIIDENDHIARNLRLGKKVKLTRAETLQKLGQLFQLRHFVNLTSDLLDTPDFYWDREHLEKLYQKCYNFLEITRRTRVMNSKLNYCVELMELVKDQLNDKHHVNLEWMIIVLILIEVVFEIVALFRDHMRSYEQ